MKKLTKILLATGGAALICGASVMTYLKAQTQQPEMSDLTLQNLEAMATIDVPDMNWANGPGKNVSCSRCGSVHLHCLARNDNRCSQTSCL
ncbi:NVEALA domain-containing protein [uncultured Rikenella sp.]|uniref:NVEALA domain-containing protein n=1 Tax=uncultured Rikenella sp. TaxID=368003 RepID=UPI0026095E51|nr:NVEALA domain-containing protein [uncultured Rikenella sp.]